MKKYALIVAGGSGKRMQNSTPKQFLLLKNKPILMHTLQQFSDFTKIILVLPGSQITYWKELCKEFEFNLKHTITEGGENRFYSVKNGLKLIPNDSIVAIHDGVRPFISRSTINNLLTELKNGIGVIPVIPLKESIRKQKGEFSIALDRTHIYKVQTPQCFISAEIKAAYENKYQTKYTDDASVFESYKGKIMQLLGEEKNIKITHKEDLKIAEALILLRKSTSIYL